MYYIYLLRCEDNSLYTGITTDVDRRFQEHMQKGKKGAKYTKMHVPICIEAIWQCDTRSTASQLEYQLKKLAKGKKEKIVRESHCFQQLLKDKVDIEKYKRMK